MSKLKVTRGPKHKTTAAEQKRFQAADAFARWITTKDYKERLRKKRAK